MAPSAAGAAAVLAGFKLIAGTMHKSDPVRAEQLAGDGYHLPRPMRLALALQSRRPSAQPYRRMTRNRAAADLAVQPCGHAAATALRRRQRCLRTAARGATMAASEPGPEPSAGRPSRRATVSLASRSPLGCLAALSRLAAVSPHGRGVGRHVSAVTRPVQARIMIGRVRLIGREPAVFHSISSHLRAIFSALKKRTPT